MSHLFRLYGALAVVTTSVALGAGCWFNPCDFHGKWKVCEETQKRLNAGGEGAGGSTEGPECQSKESCLAPDNEPCRESDCVSGHCKLVAIADGPRPGAQDNPEDCMSIPLCENGVEKQVPNAEDKRADTACITYQCVDEGSGTLMHKGTPAPKYTNASGCDERSTCDGFGSCGLKTHEVCEKDGQDQACASGICERKKCNNKDECKWGNCAEGFCGSKKTCLKSTYDPCSSDADCSSSHACNTVKDGEDGVCRKKKGEPCSSSEECMTDLCAGGICIKCNDMTPCETGRSCTSGNCLPTCSKSTPCPPGYGPQPCSLASLVCSPECSDNNPCSAEHKCVNSFCVP